MKKLFVFMVLGLVVFSANKAQAAGCYITPTNDYICDDTTGNPADSGGSHGETVQRDTLRDIPGSSYVFQSNDVRSQFTWMPGVLINLGLNINSPAPGTTSVGTISSSTASGAGTAEWSGAECEEGTDPRVAAQQAIIADERLMTQSYYDCLGGQGNCPWSYKSNGGSRNCAYCGSTAAGCLTVGIGHLVLESEMSLYAPCGRTFTEQEMTDLFINQDFPRYWNPAVATAHEMCLSDDEAACFLVALTSINFQLGPNWVKGRRGYTGNAGDPMLAGQFKQAATQFQNSSYCSEAAYRNRCMRLVTALNNLADNGAAGCDGVAGN